MEKFKLSDLNPAQLEFQQVWKYVPAERDGEVCVSPEKAIRPRSLKNRIVATKVQLANGSCLWALLENIDIDLPEFTKHWMVCYFYLKKKWWRLARYHDADAMKHSPQELARRLGNQIEEVFPITYDVRALCSVDSSALAGLIFAEPETRLKRAEIIRLAVPKAK
ncbi:MAG: hypothetical protein ING36_08370 [Burkholderiales bacterium]|jgi:hypothetical protein|nr:hypothetical protein [Burkholderiales bacterium]